MTEDIGNSEGESLPAYPKNILTIHLFSYVLNYKIFTLRELAMVCWNFNIANQPEMGTEGAKPRGHLGFRPPRRHNEICLRPGCCCFQGQNDDRQLLRGT